MGLTAIVSSSSASAGSASATSLMSAVGLGVGGVFVAAALIVLLAYLDLVDASERLSEHSRTMLVATILPLGLTFSAIVLFQSLQAI